MRLTSLLLSDLSLLIKLSENTITERPTPDALPQLSRWPVPRVSKPVRRGYCDCGQRISYNKDQCSKCAGVKYNESTYKS